MRFSANLGFLFNEFALPDAIRAAKRQGFDAVEMHWPYEADLQAVISALEETKLPLLGVNTVRGDVGAGENGLSALPGREVEARAAIDQAIEWAVATGCRNIHVMAGKTSGDEAFSAFVENLRYAAAAASPHGVGIMIEPLNPRDAPGYFLTDLPTALRVVEATEGAVGIMYDCYHMQIVHGDLLRTVETHLDVIRHIQFASVPHRAEPDDGEVDYAWLLPAFVDAGYEGFFGAEYKPMSGSFAWMEQCKGSRFQTAGGRN